MDIFAVIDVTVCGNQLHKRPLKGCLFLLGMPGFGLSTAAYLLVMQHLSWQRLQSIQFCSLLWICFVLKSLKERHISRTAEQVRPTPL